MGYSVFQELNIIFVTSVFFDSMRKILFCVLLAGFALASCKSDNLIEPQSQYDDNGARIIHVSIPVKIEDPHSGIRFGDGKKMYLFNNDLYAMACNPFGDNTVLTQYNISTDSLSCTLTGDVTFYYKAYSNGEIVWYPIQRGMARSTTIRLFYGWEQTVKGVDGLYCDYTLQDGSVHSAIDHCYAWTYNTLMYLKDDDIITSLDTLHLKTVDSQLKIKLSFVKEDGLTAVDDIDIKKAVLSSKRDGLISNYHPYGYELNPQTSTKRNNITIERFLDQHLCLSILYKVDTMYDASDDEMTLRVIDSTMVDTYQGSWTIAPDKYLGGTYTENLVLQKQSLLVQTLYQSPVTVFTPENGKYRLGNGGDVAVYNGGAADIEGYSRLNVHLFDARLDGQIKLVSGVGNHIAVSSKIFSESSLINNPGEVAIKNVGEFPIIIAEGSTLTIKGDVDADLSLQRGSLVIVEGDIKGIIHMAVGSRMKVKGDVSGATFFATEGSIIDFTDYDPASGFTNYVAR